MAVADREREDTEVRETRGTGDVKQRQERLKKKVCLKGSEDRNGEGESPCQRGRKRPKANTFDSFLSCVFL